MKTVQGVGVNDAGYIVSANIDGVRVMCPYYRVWSTMLNRCYSKSYLKTKPTYSECVVCEDWLTFSNFKSWMETQNWQGNQLDKDLLVEGNKIYGPDNCIFVPMDVNAFMTERQNHRGDWPLGVHILPSGRFRSVCSEFGKGQTHLGVYDTPEQAHNVYKSHKARLAIVLSKSQTDKRISHALVKRYCST